MLRTVIIIRHAKAEPGLPGQSDFSRSLNERGLQDAAMMGKRLKARGIIPDLILASAAKRTASTAQLIAEALDCKEKVQLKEVMYNASEDTLQDLLLTSAINNQHKTILLIAHNPGITYLAHILSPSLQLNNMPTCGMLAVQAHVEDWTNFLQQARQFYFFDYPKNTLSIS